MPLLRTKNWRGSWIKSRPGRPCCAHPIFLFLAFHACFASGAPRQSPARAQEHAESGKRFARLNDLNAAEAEFREAVELSPNNAEYLADLGGILGIERKLDESTSYLLKALALDPRNISIRRNLASNQWQTGRLEEAKENLNRVLSVKPGDPRTVLLLGMVSEGLQEHAEAARLLESVQDLAREQPESIAALAQAYYHTSQKEKARRVLNELLGHNAGDRGLFLGAKAAVDSQDYETAERLFLSIRSAYPDPRTLGYQVALVRYRAGHFDQCQSTLARLLAAGQASVDVYDLLALCYHKQGKSAEAIRTLNESMDRIPHTEADYLKLADMLLNNKLLPAAHKVATKAVETAPDSVKAYNLKGTVELELYYYKDAIQSFSRALELDASSAEANLGLALAQWGAGKTSEATATFERGLERFPRDPWHYTKYARLLIEAAEQNGDYGMESHAVSLLQKAASLDPSLADPHYMLGNLLLSKGKAQEAVVELETAARLDVKSSNIRYALARTYRRLGRNEEALKEAQAYSELKAEEDHTF